MQNIKKASSSGEDAELRIHVVGPKTRISTPTAAASLAAGSTPRRVSDAGEAEWLALTSLHDEETMKNTKINQQSSNGADPSATVSAQQEPNLRPRQALRSPRAKRVWWSGIGRWPSDDAAGDDNISDTEATSSPPPPPSPFDDDGGGESFREPLAGIRCAADRSTGGASTVRCHPSDNVDAPLPSHPLPKGVLARHAYGRLSIIDEDPSSATGGMRAPLRDRTSSGVHSRHRPSSAVHLPAVDLREKGDVRGIPRSASFPHQCKETVGTPCDDANGATGADGATDDADNTDGVHHRLPGGGGKSQRRGGRFSRAFARLWRSSPDVRARVHGSLSPICDFLSPSRNSYHLLTGDEVTADREDTTRRGPGSPSSIDTVPRGPGSPSPIDTARRGAWSPSWIDTVRHGAGSPSSIDTVPRGTGSPSSVDTLQKLQLLRLSSHPASPGTMRRWTSSPMSSPFWGETAPTGAATSGARDPPPACVITPSAGNRDPPLPAGVTIPSARIRNFPPLPIGMAHGLVPSRRTRIARGLHRLLHRNRSADSNFTQCAAEDYTLQEKQRQISHEARASIIHDPTGRLKSQSSAGSTNSTFSTNLSSSPHSSPMTSAFGTKSCTPPRTPASTTSQNTPPLAGTPAPTTSQNMPQHAYAPAPALAGTPASTTSQNTSQHAYAPAPATLEGTPQHAFDSASTTSQDTPQHAFAPAPTILQGAPPHLDTPASTTPPHFVYPPRQSPDNDRRSYAPRSDRRIYF